MLGYYPGLRELQRFTGKHSFRVIENLLTLRQLEVLVPSASFRRPGRV
jgi:hypothetical protein